VIALPEEQSHGGLLKFKMPGSAPGHFFIAGQNLLMAVCCLRRAISALFD
jgi:hypothetical protein